MEECPACCTGFTKTILLLGMTGLSKDHINDHIASWYEWSIRGSYPQQERLSIQQPLNVNNMCKAMLKMGSNVDQKLTLYKEVLEGIGLSQTLDDVKHSIDNPLPNQFDLATRSIADNAV
jgi:hypothetical protein